MSGIKRISTAKKVPLSQRVRPDSEVAKYVYDEIVSLEARIKELENALQDLTNDCINFDDEYLSNCIIVQAKRTLEQSE